MVRFFKVASRLKHSLRINFPSWDLMVVLQGLLKSPYEPLKDAAINILTFKTALLVALVSEVGEIQALSTLSPYFFFFFQTR